MKKWTIYKHTLITGPQVGWSYIGQTCSIDCTRRWNKGHGYSHQPTMLKAILDNGGYEAWDINWVHEIIESGIVSLEEANIRERYWIAIYHTYVGDKECRGFNRTPGGSSWGTLGRIKIFKGEEKIFINENDLSLFEAEGWQKWYTAERKSLERKRYYQEHREQERAYHLKNYIRKERKPGKYKISMSEIIKNNPGLTLEECRIIYNKEYRKLYREANKQKAASYAKKYQQDHKDELNAYALARYYKNPEKHKLSAKKYRQTHRAQVNEHSKNYKRRKKINKND